MIKIISWVNVMKLLGYDVSEEIRKELLHNTKFRIPNSSHAEGAYWRFSPWHKFMSVLDKNKVEELRLRLLEEGNYLHVPSTLPRSIMVPILQKAYERGERTIKQLCRQYNIHVTTFTNYKKSEFWRKKGE